MTAAQDVSGPVETPADAEVEIVVEGQLEREEMRIETMTTAISRRPRTDKPIARQYGQICVGVFGISPDYARILIARIEENARRLGIAVAGEGCSVNTLVGFVRDGRAEVERLRKDEPWLFSTLLDYEYNRILRGNGAAQAWHATQLKGLDGKEFASALIGNPPREVAINDQFTASNIESQLRVDMIGSVVLMDAAQVTGKTLQQLADYASMRSFASVDDVSDGSPNATPTILSLFNPDVAPPEALTDFDWSYLEAVYKLPRNARGSAIHDATWSAYAKKAYGIEGGE